MNKKDFKQYLGKIIRPTGKYFQIPIKDYIVTAALYNYESFEGDSVSVFAIKAIDYTTHNKHWFTMKIFENELEERMLDFDIVEPSIGGPGAR